MPSERKTELYFRPGFRARFSVGIALLLAMISMLGTTANAAAASLNIVWLKPGEKPTTPVPGLNFVLRDVTQSHGDPIVLLAADKGSQQLIFGAANNALDQIKPLSTKATVLKLARDSGGAIWLAGMNNHRSYVPGGDIADRYLAKLNTDENILEEHNFNSGQWGLVQDLLPLESGDVIVAGRDGAATWLARISSPGKIVWEQRFGIAKRTGVNSRGDNIVVVAFDAPRNYAERKYREDVGVWIFDKTGTLVGKQVVREGINSTRGADFGNLALIRSDNASYVISSFRDLFKPRPIEVAKLDATGHTVWRKELPNSIWHRKDDLKTWQSCHEGQTVLANGNALIACAINSEAVLFELDAQNGEVTQRSVLLPECSRDLPTRLLLSQQPNGEIWLFGSRPTGYGPGCAWGGKLSLNR